MSQQDSNDPTQGSDLIGKIEQYLKMKKGDDKEKLGGEIKGLIETNSNLVALRICFDRINLARRDDTSNIAQVIQLRMEQV